MLAPCVDDGVVAASATAAAHPGVDATAGGGGAGGPGGGFPGAAARCQRSALRGRGGVQPGEQQLRAPGRDAGAAGGTAGPGEFAAAFWDVNIITVGVTTDESDIYPYIFFFLLPNACSNLFRSCKVPFPRKTV